MGRDLSYNARNTVLGSDRIRLVPLGGLGEVGMNCLALEQDDGILIVDCGVGFSNDDLGIDVYHPRFSWILERAASVAGIFLTHGHEDHIGALPYLLAELDVPVWGPPHALGLVQRRLAEHGFLPDDVELRAVEPGQRYGVGPFQIEPVRVAHSIVEATALAIETCAGRLLHTGDFNFDPDPPDGEPTDEARLSALGDQGVGLLLSDSTNIDVPQRTGSERAVGARLTTLIGDARGRVVVALFASNLQRLMLLGEAARLCGRKLCLLGRSLRTQAAVGTEIGRLRWPSDLCVSAEQAAELPRDQLLVLAGGTQAEPNSALRRLSLRQHGEMALEPGDTVILSSRIIPGNERPVLAMVDDLLRAGLIVHSRLTDPAVHTSGHACRSEQRHMLELTRPRGFLPVHGSLHHLLRHAELGREVGVANTLVAEDGDALLWDGQTLRHETTVPHGRVAVAVGGEPLEPKTLEARAELGRSGVAFVSLVVGANGLLAAPPEVATRGVPAVDGDPAALRALALEVARAADPAEGAREANLEERVRRATRRKLQDLSGTRPVLELSVSRIGP